MEDNIRLKEIKNINKEDIITTEDMIIIEAVKKIKNPFIILLLINKFSFVTESIIKLAPLSKVIL